MSAILTGSSALDHRAPSRYALEAVRQRLQDAPGDYFGADARVDLVTTRHHAYSTTGLLRVRAAHGAREVLAKTLLGAPTPAQPEQAQREHDALSRCRAIFSGHDDLRVPAPLVLYPDLQCVVMEAVPGPTLAAVLGEARFWAPRARVEVAVALCRLCGRWLQRLHAATASLATVRELDVIARLDSELAYLGAHPVPPVTASDLTAVRAHVRRLLDRVGAAPVPVVAVHGGFAPYNVIVSPDRRAITVIDFAAFTVGPVHYDYFKFRSKLEMLAFGPSFSSRVIRRLEGAFADGYGRPVDPNAPLNQILRIGFTLDRMTAFAENPTSRPLRRRFLLRRLFRRHYRVLKELCEA